MTNDRLDRLAEFPFRRLHAWLAEPSSCARPTVDLSIGEPRHAPPALLAETVAANAHLWNRYPPPTGTEAFRAAVAAWLTRRHALPGHALDADRHVLPLAGSKEGLFLLSLLAVGDAPGSSPPVVLMPNPLYAVYQGAAVMAGAEPRLMPATARSGYLPDLDSLTSDLLRRVALFYLGSPANPQGAVADAAYLARAIALAREYGFILAVDECYSEIWDREPPPGALSSAWRDGGGFERVVVFNSLSKRSSAAGLRSGFIAGDPHLLADFARLRAYAAAVQPLPLMAAATALWGEETHVTAGRDLYRQKIDGAERCLSGRFGFYRPEGGFFLWLDVGNGEVAARLLWQEAAIKVLPGAFLGIGATGTNPGMRYIRVALVDAISVLDPALRRMADLLDDALVEGR